MRSTAAALLAFLLLQAPAAAQTPDLASDNEMFAGYCQGLLEKWQAPRPVSCAGADEAMCRGMKARAEADAAQFRALGLRLGRYLEARGYEGGRSPAASRAVATARQVGRDDGAICPSDGLPEPTAEIEAACSSRCQPPSGSNDSEACVACRTGVTPLRSFPCGQSQRCLDVTSLPF
jgi:hypothetical protein